MSRIENKNTSKRGEADALGPDMGGMGPVLGQVGTTRHHERVRYVGPANDPARVRVEPIGGGEVFTPQSAHMVWASAAAPTVDPQPCPGEAGSSEVYPGDDGKLYASGHEPARVSLVKATAPEPDEQCDTPACPSCGAHDWETYHVEVWSKLEAFTIDPDDANGVLADSLAGSPAVGADSPSTGLYGRDDWGVSCIECGHKMTADTPLSPEILRALGTDVTPADDAPECDECGEVFPDGDDGPGPDHAESCSAHTASDDTERASVLLASIAAARKVTAAMMRQAEADAAPLAHPDDLNARMDFDRVVEVLPGGIIRDRHDIHAPDVEGTGKITGTDADLSGLDSYATGEAVPMWTALTGYSGQDRYAGPCMHRSEYIGGGLARDIIAEPGIYTVVVVRFPDDCDLCEGSGKDRNSADDCARCDGSGIDPEDSGEGDSWAVLRMIDAAPLGILPDLHTDSLSYHAATGQIRASGRNARGEVSGLAFDAPPSAVLDIRDEFDALAGLQSPMRASLTIGTATVVIGRDADGYGYLRIDGDASEVRVPLPALDNLPTESPAPHVMDGRPVLIVVRDPDSANDYQGWPGVGVPAAFDVDLGNIWPDEDNGLTEAWGDELAELKGHPAHGVLLEIVLRYWKDDRPEADTDGGES